MANFIVFLDGWEPQDLLAVFDYHDGGQLLRKTRGIDLELFGYAWEFTDIDAEELQLWSSVEKGVGIPKLLGLSKNTVVTNVQGSIQSA